MMPENIYVPSAKYNYLYSTYRYNAASDWITSNICDSILAKGGKGIGMEITELKVSFGEVNRKF